MSVTNEVWFVIAEHLGRLCEEVDQRLANLRRPLGDRPWAPGEIYEFRNLYGTMPDEVLSRIFSRPVEFIRDQARDQALAKSRSFRRRHERGAVTPMPRWTDEETERLRELYPVMPNREIALLLQRSIKSVISKAHHLGLHKSRHRLRQMGRENVRRRYEAVG